MNDRYPPRVLRHFLRVSQARNAASVLEVGPVRPSALTDWQSIGIQVTAFTDTAPEIPTTPDQVLIGDVASGMPIAAHTIDCVLLRSARTFSAGLQTPESLLGSANLLSCLKPGGALIVAGAESGTIEDWNHQLSRFPVRVSRCEFQDGLGFWLSMKWLRGEKKLQLSFLLVEIGREAMSRLQWHRMVREMVMKRPAPAEDAATKAA